MSCFLKCCMDDVIMYAVKPVVLVKHDTRLHKTLQNIFEMFTFLRGLFVKVGARGFFCSDGIVLLRLCTQQIPLTAPLSRMKKAGLGRRWQFFSGILLLILRLGGITFIVALKFL